MRALVARSWERRCLGRTPRSANRCVRPPARRLLLKGPGLVVLSVLWSASSAGTWGEARGWPHWWTVPSSRGSARRRGRAGHHRAGAFQRGWQSATAVVEAWERTPRDPMGVARPGSVDPAVGETVLLEVAPARWLEVDVIRRRRADPRRRVNRRGRRALALQGMIVAFRGPSRLPRGRRTRGTTRRGSCCTRASRWSSGRTAPTRSSFSGGGAGSPAGSTGCAHPRGPI